MVCWLFVVTSIPNFNVSQLHLYFSTLMMTSSSGNIFRVTDPLCGEFTCPGEFPTQRPVTRSFDGFFDLRLNKRLSKQSLGWWFEMPSWSLWRHCNVHSCCYTKEMFFHWPLMFFPGSIMKWHNAILRQSSIKAFHFTNQLVNWLWFPLHRDSNFEIPQLWSATFMKQSTA